jgi:hypothetical protein
MQYIQLQGQVAADLDTPLEGGYNLFIDTTNGSIKAKDSEGNLTGGAGGGGLVETTYNGLTASLATDSLTPGTYYKITDFRTCYDQPDYDVSGDTIEVGNYRTGSISPIIVFALDSASLASDAYQPEYPNDKIKYDITFNQTEVTDSPAFGRIIYRKDNQGNEMDYDFREVLFKRYDAYYSEQVYEGTISVEESGSFAFITGSGTSFENFTTGSIVGVLNINNNPLVFYYEIVSIEDDYRMVVTGSIYNSPSDTRLLDANLLEGVSWKQNNILSNTASIEIPTFDDITGCFNNTSTNTAAYTVWDEYTFLLPNNVFKGENTYRDNSFSQGFRNNTFNAASSDSNRVMGGFNNNIINNDFDNNTINNNFYNNIIVCDFRYNTVNGEFHNNHFGDEDEDNFEYNIINGEFYNNFYTAENNFEYNIINGGFDHNIILDEFSKNTLNGFNNNVLGDEFGDNRIGESFYGNKTYNEFRENTIADLVYQNNFFSSFLGNTLFGNEVYDNNFYSYVEDNQIGSYFHNNDIGESDDYGDTNFSRNKIGNDFYDNIVSQSFEDNVIGTNFYDNIINNEFLHNNIGSDFELNTIGSVSGEHSFEYNQIGYGMSKNLISGSFSANKIGYAFVGNEIGDAFNSNTINSIFAGNDIGEGCISNRFGDHTVENNIGNDFAENFILNDFSDNTITNDFKGNKIGNDFNDNMIGDGFGFGGSNYKGNIIGNSFTDNIIGEYFYDNNIGDRFTYNRIGNDFQYNRIETELDDYDFTTYLGNINIVSSSITDGTDGVYSDLTGSTAGFGSGSVFEVTVASSLVSNIAITNSGNLYEVDDTITIASGSFGGTTDLVLTVTELQSAPMVYGNYNKTIQRRFDGTIVLTALDDNNQFYISQQITEPID